ncbi:small integral membrane protein 11A, partial [Phasianus colchicus]|uniref:small integral membrane protein 11A n=1 Tax=Phasianus colchicus TaxID=9054 RepID=UPI00129E1811
QCTHLKHSANNPALAFPRKPATNTPSPDTGLEKGLPSRAEPSLAGPGAAGKCSSSCLPAHNNGRPLSIWNVRGAAEGIVNISIAASADASALDCAFRSVTLIGAGHSLLQNRHYQPSAKMVAFNLKALENFPLLMYILAAKTLILCLAFAGVKMYQSKKIEEKLKREREEKLKREAEKKGD